MGRMRAWVFFAGGAVVGSVAASLVSWTPNDPEEVDRVATFGEYVAPPGRDVEDSLVRTVSRTEAFGGAAVSRVHEFVLIVVNRTENMSEGNIPRIECAGGSENILVFEPADHRGEYPTGLEGQGARTLASTFRFACEFEERVSDAEVEVRLIERGREQEERVIVFRDPFHGVDRVKWEHEGPTWPRRSAVMPSGPS